jgi:hypothetical protein
LIRRRVTPESIFTEIARFMQEATDPSERFILRPGSPLPENLAALWMVDARLAREIETLDDPGAYPVEISKSGLPTVGMQTPDGRKVFLHSRHQPIEEARRLLEPIAADEKMTFYLLGFGLGYHAELLFEKASAETIFCIFEPDLRMLRTALEHRDLTKLIRSGRMMFFHQANKPVLFQKLTPHTALISLGSEIVQHPASIQLNDSFYRQIETWLGEFASFCRTNMNTLVLNSRKTAENIARNIGWYAAAPGLTRLKDRYQSRPAVIVSAGPSLRKNKHLLHGLDANAVIIAVQTTLQPLLEMGIEPHFVTSLDYHEICTRFFEKLPKNIRTELVAEAKATTAIFGMMPGPVNFTGNDFAESLLRELELNKPILPSGATVAHLAFYLAEYLGCDPIIFVGQDLGFSDGLCYMPGTSYEDVWRPELSRFCTMEMKQWEHIARDRPILRQIPDHLGRPMYTEERLWAYLHQFERDFGKSTARIIDATEGGALKRGTTIMKLADAIEQYCRQPLPSAENDCPALQWDRLEAGRKSILARRDEAMEIEQISRQTLPLLEEIRDHQDDQGRVNRAIARVDAMRGRMDEVGKTYELVTQLTQQSELQRFKNDRKIAAARLDAVDRQSRQVSRDIENVKAMITAAREFQDLMRDVAGLLEKQIARHQEAAK